MLKQRSVLLGVALAALLVGGNGSTPAAATSAAKFDRAIADATRGATDARARILVQVRSGSADAVLGWLRTLPGVGLTRVSSSPDLLVAEVAAGLLDRVAAHGDVLHVSSDAPVKSLDDRHEHGQDSGLLAQNTLLGTEGLLATDGQGKTRRSPSYTGQGVTIALLDSGIAPSDDLNDSIVDFYDFTNGGRKAKAFDDYGHGTHVAGLIGSDRDLSRGLYEGVAPQAKFLALKVLDENGAGFTSDVIDAINFTIANRARYRVRVMNLSLGHPIYESAINVRS